MTLHIFNPEHDLALASGLSNFTAPHAGRQLRHDLSWLPALWANNDDVVLVEDVEKARRAINRRKVKPCLLAGKQQLASLPISSIEPWGWNKALRAQLLRLSIDEQLMPNEAALAEIRNLSHRRTAAMLLPHLQQECTVGEAHECTTEDQVKELMERYENIVIKAPWSSSGRGIRFFTIHNSPLTSISWLRNVISRQGSVMVEPYYHKMKDFGMEFMSDGQGNVTYLGLSLFHTTNGAYKGNLIATEQAKRQLLGRYIPLELLDTTQQKICQLLGKVFENKYQGPFGVDMMVIKSTQPSLHPCVEINLRRTMGHMALALGQKTNPTSDDDIRHVMRIDYTDKHYKLRIKRL